jgi:hypothetical protein
MKQQKVHAFTMRQQAKVLWESIKMSDKMFNHFIAAKGCGKVPRPNSSKRVVICDQGCATKLNVPLFCTHIFK